MAKKYLKQRSSNDCAIAALAMLLNETYAEMRRVTFDYFAFMRVKYEGMTEDQGREIVKLFGKRLKVWYVTDNNRKNIIQKLQGRKAVICVPIRNGRNALVWHAVYWDGGKLYDPNDTPTERYGTDGKRAFKLMRHVEVLHCAESSRDVD